jgi:2-polyprenyl-6-methoxyphenol hydroxylase-like FAD-dependent oxidoreductase
MGGLTAARVLADHFEQVLVLERDTLPAQSDARSGVPQGKHAHALLAGGQQVLGELFPGFERDLVDTGAVALNEGVDTLAERPGPDPIPQRDLGFMSYAQSRPQLELNVRQRVLAQPNIELRQRCRVQEFVASEDRTSVCGLIYTQADRQRQSVQADLIVDASGRGALTLDLLNSSGHALPKETPIGVNITYATAIFEIPDDLPQDWKAVYTIPRAPEHSRGGLLIPMEGQRWILSLGGRKKGEEPPADVEGFMAFVRQLPTPTIYHAIQHAKRIGDIASYRFPESAYRHYQELNAFPQGLLPLGDAICRFNPVYGQGMSVAAQEARALGRLLADRASSPAPLDGLAAAFFAQADAIIDTPWAMAAIPDFIYPETRGERPADFEQRLKAGMAMDKLAARDPAVHKLVAEVAHLLKPRRVFQEPELQQRLRDVMAEA